MNRRRWLLAALALWLIVVGCAPLTFSRDEAIDFDRYQSVFVTVTVDGFEDAVATEYLATELERDSGFRRVTTDPAETVDLTLEVRVVVSGGTDSDGEPTYHGEARYRAYDANGALVDEGEEQDDSSSMDEAAEDVLDEIALHYHGAYRL